MCGNSSSILRGGWKALDTLGRKPLDPIFWSDNIRAGQSSLNARLSQYRIVSKFVSSSLRIYDQHSLMTISPFTHIQRVCIAANFQIGFRYKDLKWNSKGEHDVIFLLIVSIFLFSCFPFLCMKRLFLSIWWHGHKTIYWIVFTTIRIIARLFCAVHLIENIANLWNFSSFI